MNCKKYEDLYLYKEKYDFIINNFLISNSETKVVFLNADFGFGKSTFVNEILNVPKKNIFSPWLNPSNDYLEELYCITNNINKSIINSKCIFLSFLFAFFTIFLNYIGNILINLFTNNYNVSFLYGLFSYSFSFSIIALFLFSLLLFFIIIVIAWFIIYKLKPIPLFNYFMKNKGYGYDDSLIKSIVDKIDKLLVIEDIDRCENIDSVLIAINKISNYLVESKSNKYVLITGDYGRTINKLNHYSNENDYNYNEIYNTEGSCCVDKIVSLKIDFLEISTRIENILNEKDFKLDLCKIEMDEVINFIKLKNLNVRFFIRFLDNNRESINNGESFFHLLVSYYKEQRVLLDENMLTDSIYNTEIFPKCLNDIELLLNKKKVIINGKIYTIKNLKLTDLDEYTSILINLLLPGNNHIKKLVFKYYLYDIYPVSYSYYDTVKSSNLSLFNSLPDSKIPNVCKFLIGNINENEKRCYFYSKGNFIGYNDYYVNNINSANFDLLNDEDAFIGYFGTFFRKNKNVLKKYYPKFFEYIEKNSANYDFS